MARTKNEVLTITCATFDGLLVIKPAGDIVPAFEAVITSIFHLLPASQQQSSNLAAIRDCLLPSLLSGAVCFKIESELKPEAM
ncbi:hypothetical protein [Thioalkalivibrio sp. HK1]|uniref:hypothetical protein n=1 Tax=Thioalkalivibrio sp. HK1 TaxID=1469245 RepID=UPI0012DF421E|nr:hypothetical protein [Thioalkalivibrio sp. HK1]